MTLPPETNSKSDPATVHDTRETRVLRLQQKGLRYPDKLHKLVFREPGTPGHILLLASRLDSYCIHEDAMTDELPVYSGRIESNRISWLNTDMHQTFHFQSKTGNTV
jgi:hypothetical protein